MNKYYIQDNTIGKYVYFDTLNELVAYYNTLIPRAFHISRNQYMQNLIDLGHGYDDKDGVTITQALADQFNIGIVKKNGTLMKTDVHAASRFLKEEYGD
jgi:hypothetical protein